MNVADAVIDLHSHYPMHVAATDPAIRQTLAHESKVSIKDRIRAFALRTACELAAYEGEHQTPAVTTGTIRGTNVRVLLSVLYVPWDEMDLSVKYETPTQQPRYYNDLKKLIVEVENSLANQDDVVVARSLQAIDDALAHDRHALVHCIEGGFHLSDNDAELRQQVAELRALGVAYITVAHLFFRKVATNAPALPFLPDWLYKMIFHQPNRGLEPAGEQLIRAMVANRILIDTTHMSAKSFKETMALLDEIDPAHKVPVLASHGACHFKAFDYNLTKEQVEQIAARDGVIGLIACTHYMAKGFRTPGNFDESVDLLCKHIEQIHAWTGSYRNIAIGSDHDGFIKPALTGLQTPAGLSALKQALTDRLHDEAAAGSICFGNARRLLEYWG